MWLCTLSGKVSACFFIVMVKKRGITSLCIGNTGIVDREIFTSRNFCSLYFHHLAKRQKFFEGV